ncbi:MAG: glycosyltransferase family 39 protein [Candidatus Marinimicrobia bacterium]|nr:glycosyltransferase family 39 protein [Candidatus Neomarinimicrobiota bacterium]
MICKSDKNAFLILFFGLVVRSITAWLTVPGFDEAYYGVYTMFPAWGYFDHPPLVTVSAGIGHWLFPGFSTFTLRIGAIFIFSMSAWILYKITQELYDQKAAINSLFLFHIIPYFLVGIGCFVLPDNFLTFFWLLALYAMVRYQKKRSNLWLLVWGASIGFGFLSKYHMVLLIAGFGWLLLFHKNFKELWKNPWFYFAVVLGMIIMVPNLTWNYHNNWISYVYQFGKSRGSASISITKFLQGILSQTAYIMPWNFLVLLFGFKKTVAETAWLRIFAFLPVFIFTMMGFTQTILPHWTMVGYLTLLIPAGAWISKIKKAKIYILLSSITTMALLVIVLIQSHTGFIPLKPRQDFTLDGFGWKEMVGEAIKKNDFEGIDFLAGHKWFTAGEILFAIEGKMPTLCLNSQDPRGFAFWYDLKAFEGKNCLFISTNRYNTKADKKYQEYFTTIMPLDTIHVYRGKEIGKSFYLWKCENFSGKMTYPYGINHE